MNTGLGYASIQEAINANETLDGHTIFVEAGTYYENVVISKSLTLIGEGQRSIIDGNKTGTVVYVNANNITITGFTIRNSSDWPSYGIWLGWWVSYCNIMNNSITNNGIGIRVYQSTYNTIMGNNITNNGQGIYLDSSSNNIISGNNIATNTWEGIKLIDSDNNIIHGNSILNNQYGIYFGASDANNVSVNNMVNNEYGVFIGNSLNNTIYHNNFINNTQQVDTFFGGYTDVWDDGYPFGGNYWSDYVERYPHAEELGGSGLWDTPYVIDEDNQDRYPLMYPYGTQTYKLTITTTSGGTTTPSPRTHTYANGTIAEVTAIPNIGFSFNYWLFDGEKRTENPITVIIDSNHTLAAYFVDDIRPEISEPWQDPPPNNVQPFQNVTVRVNVTDYGTGIKNVTLWYSINNGTSWTIINMTALPIPSDTWITYEATIDGYENCTWVTYKIIAYDNAENNATKDNNGYGYKYHVIPEYPSTLILVFIMATTLITTSILKIKKRRQLL
jgi:parallel beta-helix repeat protein